MTSTGFIIPARHEEYPADMITKKNEMIVTPINTIPLNSVLYANSSNQTFIIQYEMGNAKRLASNAMRKNCLMCKKEIWRT